MKIEYIVLIVIASLIGLSLLIASLFFIRKKRQEKIVKATSNRVRMMNELNSTFPGYETRYKHKFNFTERVSNKRAYDNYDFLKNAQKLSFEFIQSGKKKNQNVTFYQDYVKAFDLILKKDVNKEDIKKAKIRANRYKKIENELIKKGFKYYTDSEEVTMTLKVIYTTPKGRYTYEKEQVFKPSDLYDIKKDVKHFDWSFLIEEKKEEPVIIEKIKNDFDFEIDGNKYLIKDEESVYFVKPPLDTKRLSIPSHVIYSQKDYKVLVPLDALSSLSELEFLSLPDNITTLKEGFISSLTALKELHLPSSLLKIESHAMSHLESLESLVLPSRVQVIESEAFSFCVELKKIFIPKSVKVMGEACFFLSQKLTIYLESSSLPTGFDENFNSENSIVVFNSVPSMVE